MKKPNEKKAHRTEDTRSKSTPVAPVIETPVPPQDMDPSIVPENERKNLPVLRGKGEKESKKTRPVRS